MNKTRSQSDSGNQTVRAGTARSDQPVSDRGSQTRRVSSADLLQGEKRIIIEHVDADYLLQLTGKGKLILTK